MSIKIKLILSYIAMLVVPVALSVVVAIVLLVGFLGYTNKKGVSPNLLGELAKSGPSIVMELDRVTKEDPDKLKNVDYLNDLDTRLLTVNSMMAIISKDQVIYSSKRIRSIEKVKEFIKPIDKNGYEENHVITMGERTYNVIDYDLKFKDEKTAKLLILSDFSPIGEFVGKYFSALTIAVIIILIFTNGILTYVVSRSIIKPLKSLKQGALQIKEGNLNYKIQNYSRDEIGEVCSAFEEMRCKLKESIDTQIQFEENRKELISSISHDLKTPITAIKGYVEGIMDGVADTPEKMDKYIKTIYAKSNAMDKLIDDLFLFSKLDLKKLPFTFEKVDIKGFFEDCIDEIKMDLEKKSITIHFESDLSDNTFVLADRDKMKRVTVNIIENAVKYMDKEDGKITIRLKEDQDFVIVQVEDNGQGISREDLPNIFERFFRADLSRNSTAGGSGLGLAIVKQIVEGHDGKIWAESEMNKGTSIFFTLKKVKSEVVL